MAADTPSPSPRPSHPDSSAYSDIGSSIHVGGRTAQGQPSLNRAIAFRVDSDHRMSVSSPTPTADALLAALREVPSVAIVSCQPTTHQTVQIKGRDAVVARADAQDWQHRSAHKQRFSAEIRPFGFNEDFASAWSDFAPDQMHSVTFTP
ncbi:hypothetical protein OY671_011494, partial [Metschnikowia pulcherrima]